MPMEIELDIPKTAEEREARRAAHVIENAERAELLAALRKHHEENFFADAYRVLRASLLPGEEPS